MKKIILLLLSFCCVHAYAQRVENVHAKQSGDRIYIYYDLVHPSCNDKFDVAVLASVNDGSRKKLSSVSGDVGDDILPGKQKRIKWEVLDEVDNLNTVRFYIQVEPAETKTQVKTHVTTRVHYGRYTPPKYHTSICNKPEKTNKPKKRKSKGLFFAYNASESMHYGGRIGRLNAIGSYMAVRVGNGAPGEDNPFSTGSFMVGPSLRLIKTRSVKIYAYGGLGVGRWYTGQDVPFRDRQDLFPGTSPTSRPPSAQDAFATGLEYEWGGIVTLGRLTFTGGITTLRDYRSEATFGLGFTFGSNY